MFLTFSIAALTPLATLSVEAVPFLRTLSRLLRTPSCANQVLLGRVPVAHLGDVTDTDHCSSTVLIGNSFNLSNQTVDWY